MSLDGGSVDNAGEIVHLQTAEDLRARAAALGAEMHEGEAIEISGINTFFRDIPPEICSTLFPQNFLAGQDLPDSANSYASIKGVYSSGNIAMAGRDQFLEIHPEEKFRPDPNASLSRPFASATNIASLALDPSDPQLNGPDLPRFG